MAISRDSAARRYLLGTLPEDERQRLEAAYFADPAAFERVMAAEHALVDDYLERRLPADDRDAFDRHFLATPARARRVAEARALRERATRAVLRGDVPGAGQPAPSRTWLPLAAALVLAAGLGVLVGSLGGSPTAPSSIAARTGTPAPVPAPEPRLPGEPAAPPAESPAESSAPIVALTLTPLATRGDDDGALARVRAGTPRVEVDLVAGGPPQAGRVEIRGVDSGLTWHGAARAAAAGDPRGTTAHAALPMPQLAPGDYVLTLSPAAPADAPPLAVYTFRVVPR